MATLLLRLAGPMQSWGADSHFDTRRTELEPTKSGLVGMLAASLGRRRDEAIDDLVALGYGVRSDQPGTVIEDFQTVRGEKNYVTRRYYLSDAVFLVGIETEELDMLNRLSYSLNHPAFPLFLGRRSCPPDPKMVLEIVDMSLKEALETYPFQGKNLDKNRKPTFSLEGNTGKLCKRLQDEPVSFNPINRRFKNRLVSHLDSDPIRVHEDQISKTDHDAFGGLEAMS